MKLKKWFSIQDKDLGLGLVLGLGLLLVAAKLVLCSAQNVYLNPDGAVLDDMVMYDGAVAITEGDWLGEYGWKTLSKHSFFSLWLAGLHMLRIPYLLGGQLLWAGAAVLAAGAFMPVLKKRWLGLGLFAVLWFSPATVANPVPEAFTLRVYRDNIFPALCLICVAGIVGYALRCRRRPVDTLGWLAAGGLGFAAAWLAREDGWWLSFFVIGAAVATAVLLLGNKQMPLQGRLVRCAVLVLPFGLLAAGVLGWSAANQARYGVFIVSDFSQGAFVDAYGAMTRVEHEDWNPRVDVPRDVRYKLYALVPALDELRPYLDESDWYLGRYAGEDYNSGSLYWAMREAAWELGYYDSPQKAEVYWADIARQVNALCDDGTLAAGPRRSSVSPPIKAAYVAPVLAEGLHSLWFCATFRQCDARSIFSPGSNDAVYYAEKIAPMEDFLHEKALTVTKENSTEAYFGPTQQAAFLCFDVIRGVYAVALPLALAAALCWLGAAGMRLFKHKSTCSMEKWMLWLCCAGLLLAILLRAAMIAFVTVSSFEIGTYVMYLASIHPLMLMLGFVGVVQLGRLVAARRVTRRDVTRREKGVA